MSLIASVSENPNARRLRAPRRSGATTSSIAARVAAAIAGDAAVGPFDAAVAGGQAGLGQHRPAGPRSRALARSSSSLSLAIVVDVGGRRAPRRAASSPDAGSISVASAANLGERLARDQLGRELARRPRPPPRPPRFPAAPRCRRARARARPCPSAISASAAAARWAASALRLRLRRRRNPCDSACDSASARRRSASTSVMVGFSPVAKSSSNRYLAVACHISRSTRRRRGSWRSGFRPWRRDPWRY